MTSTSYESPQAGPDKVPGTWPRQVKFILGNEAAERFSYYGMKGILALYITGVLMMTDDSATTIIHVFVMINYFTPVLGAWVSDRLWGRYRTILWISLFYCLGHGVLACSDLMPSLDARRWCLYAGLGLIAFGAGGIKPCVSAFMGDQFRPHQGHLIEKAYATFYWMINLGSLLSFLIIPKIKDHSGYGWAFGVPGIAMAIATFVFWKGTRHYDRVPPSGDPAWRTKVLWLLSVLAAIIALMWINASRPGALPPAMWAAAGAFVIAAAVWTRQMLAKVNRAPAPLAPAAFTVWWYAVLRRLTGKSRSLWDGLDQKFTAVAVDHGISYGRILTIFSMIPVFWALFDQTQSTWVIQGNQMASYDLWGWIISAETMQAANPALVMAMIPVATLLLYPALGKLATPLRRMSIGMFLAASSYLIVAWLQSRVDSGETVSILWQLVPYIILTLAEVLISTTGLEFAFTQAAPAMKSTISGYWQLTVAAGNGVVVLLTMALGGHGDSSSVSPGRFMLYAGLTFVVAIAFCFIAARYRYRQTAVN